MPQSNAKYYLRLVPHPEDHDDPNDWCPPLDRRGAIRLLGMSALATLAGCGAGTGASVTSSSNNKGSTTSVTALTPSVTSVATGTALTLTAAVTPSTATGSVTFYNGTTVLGSGNLTAGSATMSTSFSTAGSYALKAVYAGDANYAGSTSSTVTVTVTGSTSTCGSSTREGEEGPYFVDDSASGYARSNILSNLDGSNTQTGVPFVLTLYVLDAKNNCAAMQNVQVDIWHCNASGVYSAESSESTASQSWLRGYQITDANGMVKFTTIVPGWYSGRTTHIHLRLRSTYDLTSNSGTNTMQLFFDQTLIDTLDTTVAPYASEGKNTTTNASDRVYSTEEGGTTLMTLSGSITAGFTATAKAYLPIVQTY